MSTIDHAIWWQVYPLGACGAPIREVSEQGVQHRLSRLEHWLDYAISLGCNGLILAPIFASTSHGYDTTDHFRIDPRLGDDADFDHFVAACRDRGLMVMLDGVFNHVGVKHEAVQAALAAGDENGPIALERVDGELRPRPWEGHGDLAELNHASEAAKDLTAEIMLHWLRRGIVGWRLDVAYAVPSEFWRDVLARVRQEFPDAIFLGEVIHGDYPQIAADGTLSTVTQYELWKAIWSSVKDTNCWELAWALERHNEFCHAIVPNTFAGNHDVDRVASLIGPDGAALAAVVVATVPGMPSIYYGDEQGFTGTKGEGWEADDAIRPPLPETPDQLLPDGAWLMRLYRDAMGLRRRNPWLTHGELAVEDKTNETITYAVRGDGHEARVRLDLTQMSAVVQIDGAEALRRQP